MACICSRSNACSDWLTVVYKYYSPVVPTGRLRAYKDRAKIRIMNYLLTTSEVFTGKSQTSTLHIDLAIAS